MTDPTPTDRAPEQSDQLQEQLEHAALTCPLGYIVVKESDFNAAHAAQESAQATIESLEKFRDHYQEESDAGLATISELTRRAEGEDTAMDPFTIYCQGCAR